jgi:hypothetical protein
MSDPQSLGLSELSQRVQAMASPAHPNANDARHRSYQGAPLPIGPAGNGRPFPMPDAYPGQQPHEDVRVSPPPPTPFPGPAFVPQQYGTPAAASPAYGIPAAPAYDETPAPEATSELGPDAPAAAPTNAATSPATNPAASPAAAAQDDPNAPKTSLQRIVSALRAALPVVQKLLPLLDGNFANSLGALMIQPPQQPQHPPQPTEVHVDLEPVERGLAELRASNRDLRGQVQEQTVSLKRVEDQLDRVREATDRNTLEQQELVEDLRAVGSRISTLTWFGVVLLLVLLGLNVYFLIQLQHILR